MKKKAGDTLVEVVLAIAIFSMVGVAAVAVISASTSGSQEALELTITREAVDEQAELLRYIHSSVLVGMRSDVTTGSNKYRELWSKMIENAVTSSRYDGAKDFINNYGNTTSCSALYDGQLDSVGAFVLNPRQIYLGDYGSGNDWEWKSEMADKIVVQYDNDRFKAAATSPRLIYGSPGSVPGSADESIYEMNGTGNEIAVAEGLFVFAVQDQSTTSLIQANNVGQAQIDTEGAFYDFYIRSCWFGAGAERPSTVSTLVRLVDPTKVGVASTERSQTVTFYAGGGYYGPATAPRTTPLSKTYTWQLNTENKVAATVTVSVPTRSEIPSHAPTGTMSQEGKTYRLAGFVLSSSADASRDFLLGADGTANGQTLAIRYNADGRAENANYTVCIANSDTCNNLYFSPVWEEVDYTRNPSEERL